MPRVHTKVPNAVIMRTDSAMVRGVVEKEHICSPLFCLVHTHTGSGSHISLLTVDGGY